MHRLCAVVMAGVICVLAVGCTAKKVFEERYYVGVYDQKGRTIPQFYRYTVTGWSKGTNKTYFEAGLLPSSVARSFETKISFDDESETFGIISRGHLPAGSKARYREEYILYGPEGERQADQNLALLIAINNNPQPVLGPLQALARASSRSDPKRFSRLDLITAREIGLQGQVEVLRYLNRGEGLDFEELLKLVLEQQERLVE